MRPRTEILLAAVLAGLVGLAYAPSLRGPFLWDDATYITRNPLVTAPGGLARIWFSTDTKDYYPLTFTVLRAEWLLWGDNPWGYRLANILLHIANALVLWRLLSRLRIPGAWLAALLFALHPVNVATVAWISEVKNLISFLFAALAALAWLRHDEKPDRLRYVVALILFALSLLGKPIMAMLPVALLGFAWWQRGRVTRRDGWRAAPFFALALAFGLITVWCQQYRIMEGTSARPEGFAARLATAGWAVWFYLGKAIAPVGLCLIYRRWTVDPTAPWVYLPGLALAAVFAAAWRWRHTWGRPVLFAGGVYVAMLLPLLGFLDSGFFPFSLVADHWQYPAIAAVLAALASGLEQQRRWMECMAVALMTALCWERASLYADDVVLWRDSIYKNREAWVARFNLGIARQERGELASAEREYREALRLNPRYAEAHNNLGNLLSSSGRHAEAVKHFAVVIQLNPRVVAAHNNLGIALARLGKHEAAAECFREALRLNPGYAEARENLARVAAQLQSP
jgi:tetratricopeptide (TPR) repeat protein